jgi:hypothetical protein
MTKMENMYKMLFISKAFEPFQSPWQSWAIPTQHGNGFIIPLGWERELTKRGIEFEEIEIVEPTNETNE